MEYKGLRTAIFKVEDLNAAVKWYTDAFGTGPYFNEAFYVGFNIGGYELGLIPSELKPEEKSDNVMVYWAVDDVEDSFQRLISLGASSHEQPHNVGGPLMVASVRDPWNNVLGLIYNPDFKAEL